MSNEDLLSLAIKNARTLEKEAIHQATKRAREIVIRETAAEHEAVIEAVRRALAARMTGRAIGRAYGSSDPNTIKQLITEATTGVTTSSDGETLEWKLTHNADGTFDIIAYALGESKLSGRATLRLDPDGENFSTVSGDEFIEFQLYKLGYKDKVVASAKL